MSLLAPLLFLAASELTLEQAIARSIERYPDARIAKLNQDEARAKRNSATGALFPRLRVEGGVQVWDRPLSVRFMELDPNSPELALLPESIRTSLAEPTVVRDQITANVQLTLAQPLSGLWPLFEARRVEVLGLEAAEAAATKTLNDLAFRVIEAYTQALQAEAGAAIAQKGIELGTSMLERAEQLQKVGMVGKADVLRANVSLASAKEAALNAKTGVELAHNALGMLIGAEPGETFSLKSPEVKDASIALDQALSQAKDARPELKELNKRIAQARTAVNIQRALMAPQLVALGSYQYTYGNKFALANQLFVGASLQWDAWEWGRQWYQIDAAKAKAEAAQLELEKVEQLLALDLRQAHTRYAIAKESLAAAQVALDANREFLETEQGRYGAGQVTATDLALAQTNYLAAENNVTQARYRALLARAALDKAMGKQPLSAP